MKLLKLSFLLMLVFTIAACNDDDTDTCLQSDWVGTYSGSVDCDGTVEDVTVTITASGSEAIVIEYETSSFSSTFDPLTPDNCSLNYSESDNGLTLTVESTLNMDNLTFKDVLSGNGSSFTCTITATRD